MEVTNSQLSNFWKELMLLLYPKKDKKLNIPVFNKSNLKKFQKMSFEEILKSKFYKTKNSWRGDIHFTKLANEISSGRIDFYNWVYIVIGEYCKKQKKKKMDLINPQIIEKISILYTVEGINKQREMFNELIETEKSKNDHFMQYSENAFDLYKLDFEQKNKLYEWVRSGYINYYFYLEAMDVEFTIDETKCSQEVYRFIKIMQIVKKNIKKQNIIKLTKQKTQGVK